MRGYLLDTHAALWAIGKPSALSGPAHHAILSGPNFLSVMSYWEVAIKTMKGKLDLGDPRDWWVEALDKLIATPIMLRAEHVNALSKLPSIHQDPFDRMLIAQASAEGLALVTMDVKVARYASKSLKVIG